MACVPIASADVVHVATGALGTLPGGAHDRRRAIFERDRAGRLPSERQWPSA